MRNSAFCCICLLGLLGAGADTPATPKDAGPGVPIPEMASRVEVAVPFSRTSGWRVARDFIFNCDMRTAQGLAFDFYCENSEPIAGFGFYLKSGAEWYYLDGGFEPGEDGKWNRVLLRKENFRPGRGAAGWSQIDGMRLSPGRNGTTDTRCAIANVQVVPAVRPTVLVVKPEEKPDGASLGLCVSFARTLRTLGVDYQVIADRDLRDGDLADVPIVALPYNHTLPDAARVVVSNFVARGGQLIAGPWQARGALESWGVRKRDGKPWPPDPEEGYGMPKVLRTAQAFLLDGHWKLSTDVKGAALMGKMISEVVPSMRGQIERRVAEARARAEAADAKAALGADDMRQKFGAWCMSPWGVVDMNWDESVKALKASGVDFIMLCMANAASASYRSAVLLERPEVATRGDALDAYVAACRKYGVEAHVWKMNWRIDETKEAAFAAQMEAEGRLQVCSSGAVKKDWLCPSDERNVQREVDAMVEIVRRGADGVQFDFIRYDDGDCCYCARCRARFERRVSRKVEPWPSAIDGNAELEEAWLRFRCDTISALVEKASAAVHRAVPKAKVSAAVFGETYQSPQRVGQDWIPWLEKGWLDFACPMTYTDDNEAYLRLLKVLRKRSDKPMYPGIGVSVWGYSGLPDAIRRMREQIKFGRELGFGGFSMFTLDRFGTATTKALWGEG